MKTKYEVLFVSSHSSKGNDAVGHPFEVFKAITNQFSSSFAFSLCALVRGGLDEVLPVNTKYVFNVANFLDYIDTAEKINRDKNIKIVFLRHEFNLFNGESGVDVLFFLNHLKKPIVVAFDCVLSDQTPEKIRILKRIAEVCRIVVVKKESDNKLLRFRFGIPNDKLKVINEGSHMIESNAWQNDASAYDSLFKQIVEGSREPEYHIEDISLSHMRRLTSRIGVLHRSNMNLPDMESGYTLEDNAIALISVLRHYELTKEPGDKLLIDTYLNFITFCRKPDGSYFNYVNREGHGKINKEVGSPEDSEGLVIWALGEFISRGYLFHNYYTGVAEFGLLKCLLNIEKLGSLKAIAYAIKGLYYYNRIKESKEVLGLMCLLADRLMNHYRLFQDTNWFWFQDKVVCSHCVLSEAMLLAYLSTGKETYKLTAKHSMDFLLSCYFYKDQVQIITGRSWYKRAEINTGFDLSPADIGYLVMALDLFHQYFKEDMYLSSLKNAFSWYYGNNHLNQTLYDAVSKGCRDALGKNKINLNQSSFSTACYTIARCLIDKYHSSGKITEDSYKEPTTSKKFTPSNSDFIKNLSLVISA